ncbi:hypothetical protein EMIT0P294_80238 [Pseudomonas sp. IT-P294]
MATEPVQPPQAAVGAVFFLTRPVAAKYLCAPLHKLKAKPRIATLLPHRSPYPSLTIAHVRSQSVSELWCLLFPFSRVLFLG